MTTILWYWNICTVSITRVTNYTYILTTRTRCDETTDAFSRYTVSLLRCYAQRHRRPWDRTPVCATRYCRPPQSRFENHSRRKHTRGGQPQPGRVCTLFVRRISNIRDREHWKFLNRRWRGRAARRLIMILGRYTRILIYIIRYT